MGEILSILFLMKKLLKYIIIAMFPGNIMAQWIPIASTSSQHLNDLFFTGKDTAFIVGNNGEMLRTTSAGNSWSQINNSITHNLNTIYFPSKMIGYTNRLKTINGGTTWGTITFPLQSQLTSLYFINDTIGFFTDMSGYFGKTTDGGLTWSNQTSPVSAVLEKIEFTSDSIGYMAGWYGGSIFKTIDQGNTWFQINSELLYSLKFPSQDTGYAVGWYGKIIKTTDAGNTWTTLNSGLPTNYRLYEIFCTNSNICYAVGDSGTILKTIDGGNTWLKGNSGTTAKLNSVFFTDENTGFIVGNNGLILKTTNGGNGINDTDNKKSKIKIFPNPALESVTIEIEDNIVNEGKPIFILFDLSGKQILNFPIKKNKTKIETGNLSPGPYLYQLENNNETIDLGKIIIQ